MLIGSNEWDVSQLILEINSECFNSVSQWISGRHSWYVHQELWNNSLLKWFFKQLLVIWTVIWNLVPCLLMRNFHLFQYIVIVFFGILLLVLYALIACTWTWLLYILISFEILFSFVGVNVLYSLYLFLCFRHIEVARWL